MTIHRATTTDIPRILDLLQQVAMVHHRLRPDLFKPNTTKYSELQLEQMLRDPSSPIFVYDEQGVLGYIFCQIQETQNDRLLQNRKTLYIDDLCVHEHARGKQIGRMLFDHVRDYARSIGCQAITLNVWAGNDDAIRFYRSIGMNVLKTGMELIL